MPRHVFETAEVLLQFFIISQLQDWKCVLDRKSISCGEMLCEQSRLFSFRIVVLRNLDIAELWRHSMPRRFLQHPISQGAPNKLRSRVVAYAENFHGGVSLSGIW